jgi:tricorn protease
MPMRNCCRLVGSRQDLTFLIGEMQGELGNSHTYVGDGDVDDPTEAMPTAMLGVGFRVGAGIGTLFIRAHLSGDNTRDAYRSPLTEPGVDVHQGDFLLAVNGHELKAPGSLQPVRGRRRSAGDVDRVERPQWRRVAT